MFEPTSAESLETEQSVCEPFLRRKEPPADRSANRIADYIEAEIPFLRRMVRRWHREAADADDLVQETLLRALANAHLWEPGTSMRAWLTTIMRNQFLTAMTRAARLQAASDVSSVSGSNGPTYPEVLLTLRDLKRALKRLPEKQRSAVHLASIEGKSYSEVARLMGLTPDAVRCHLARARRRLRKVVYASDKDTWIDAAGQRGTIQ